VAKFFYDLIFYAILNWLRLNGFPTIGCGANGQAIGGDEQSFYLASRDNW
tara:strand:+ start:303 stop:452 length:150 start_codon:yes stop_codon:yes gene_type:complete